MAHIKVAAMVVQISDTALRANAIRQDPAVEKAWRAAGSDVAEAAASVASAMAETRASWRRAG